MARQKLEKPYCPCHRSCGVVLWWYAPPRLATYFPLIGRKNNMANLRHICCLVRIHKAPLAVGKGLLHCIYHVIRRCPAGFGFIAFFHTILGLPHLHCR